jgi:hypothetical protein
MRKPKFEEMDGIDQFVLIQTMSKLISETGCTGLDDFALALGRTKLEVWPIFCAEAELDECEPWMGYPGEPTAESKELSLKAPNARTPLRGVYLEMWNDHQARIKKNN